MVPAAEAAGRIGAKQITPYPPGIPAVVPGERLSDAMIDYLRSGVQAGMTRPTRGSDRATIPRGGLTRMP
jgi:arginine decarboxylase